MYLPGTTAHFAFCRIAVMTALISASSCSASLFGASIAANLSTLKPLWLLYYEPILAVLLKSFATPGRAKLA